MAYHGIRMEYAQITNGISIEYQRVCMKHLWNKHGISMGYAWITYGTQTEICGFNMPWVYFSHGIIDFYV
jgi:hypothetical protein